MLTRFRLARHSALDGGCFPKVTDRKLFVIERQEHRSASRQINREDPAEALRSSPDASVSSGSPSCCGFAPMPLVCETASTTNDSYESANLTAGRFRFGPTEQEPTSRLGSGALVLPVISRAAAARPQGPRDISWLPARGRAVLDNLGHATATRHRDRSQFEGVVRLRAVRGRNRSDTVAGPA